MVRTRPPRAGPRPRPRAAGSLPRIILEDQDLLVVEKPAGLLTIATSREKERTLYAYLYERLRRRRPPGRVFIVHRLDREASGLLVFARTPAAKRALQDQFERRTAGRTYHALVEGIIEADAFTRRSLLAENAAFHVYETESTWRAKPAVTHVRVIERLAGKTLIEVDLETGRKHQIRVHLAAAGHPVAGDRRYGAPAGDGRGMALHAASLRFLHPRTGEQVACVASSPSWWPRGVPRPSPPEIG